MQLIKNASIPVELKLVAHGEIIMRASPAGKTTRKEAKSRENDIKKPIMSRKHDEMGQNKQLVLMNDVLWFSNPG